MLSLPQKVSTTITKFVHYRRSWNSIYQHSVFNKNGKQINLLPRKLCPSSQNWIESVRDLIVISKENI